MGRKFYWRDERLQESPKCSVPCYTVKEGNSYLSKLLCLDLRSCSQWGKNGKRKHKNKQTTKKKATENIVFPLEVGRLLCVGVSEKLNTEESLKLCSCLQHCSASFVDPEGLFQSHVLNAWKAARYCLPATVSQHTACKRSLRVNS